MMKKKPSECCIWKTKQKVFRNPKSEHRKRYIRELFLFAVSSSWHGTSAD